MFKKSFDECSYLMKDLQRWKWTSVRGVFYQLLEQSIWGTVFYRISRMLFCINIPVLKIFFRLIGFIIFKFSEMFLGVAIRPGTRIGPGLYIGHAGLVMINEEVTIGKNLNIGPGVLIGKRGGGHQGAPVIGDDVYIGVGAKILGNVKIGNNVKIGANSVVMSNVPDNVTVFGAPARVIGPSFKRKNT